MLSARTLPSDQRCAFTSTSRPLSISSHDFLKSVDASVVKVIPSTTKRRLGQLPDSPDTRPFASTFSPGVGAGGEGGGDGGGSVGGGGFGAGGGDGAGGAGTGGAGAGEGEGAGVGCGAGTGSGLAAAAACETEYV